MMRNRAPQQIRLLAVAVLLLLLVLLLGFLLVQERGYRSGERNSAAPVAVNAREVAFVANVVDGTVSLLDLHSLSIVRTLDIIPDGRRVGPARSVSQWLGQGLLERRGGLNFAQDTDVSRDGRVLFVARGFLGDVAAFDIASGTLLWRTPVAGFRADHMTLSADGRHLYVSALILGGNRVQALSTSNGEIVGSFTAGQWPHDVHTSQDGSRIYVASLGDMLADRADRSTDADAYRVVVADADSLQVLRHYRFEAGVRPFAVANDEARLFAQLSNRHEVIAWDLVNDRELDRLELPVAEGVSEADWDFEAPHHGLALTADNTQLCIAGRASDYAAIVGTDPLRARHIVAVGDAPSWAALSEDGELCVVPNTRSDDVSVVSVTRGEEVARIAAGRAPKHVTIARIPDCTLRGACATSLADSPGAER